MRAAACGAPLSKPAILRVCEGRSGRLAHIKEIVLLHAIQPLPTDRGAAGGKVVPPPTSQGMEKQLQPGSGASAKHNENIPTHTRGCEEDFELHFHLTTDLAWK